MSETVRLECGCQRFTSVSMSPRSEHVTSGLHCVDDPNAPWMRFQFGSLPGGNSQSLWLTTEQARAVRDYLNAKLPEGIGPPSR